MKNGLKQGFLSIVYFLLYFPIGILILYSFNQARFSLTWHGFSFHWYQVLFHDAALWIAFFHSILLGLSASFFACLISLIVCVHFFLNRNLHQRALYTLLLLLIILPDLVLGVALLIFFNLTTIPLGFLSLLIAHITFCIPFTVITINSRIHHLDVNIYYSALDLGATRMKALTKVMFPLLWPAVLSAFLLGFTLSFDDVIISYFVAGPEYNILPLTIYSLVRAGVTPELNALCSMTFFLSMILVITAYRFSRSTA
jgi:spermidine/putrescine transport system permease protein